LKVGLIIPVFNRPLYLEKCFDSLLKADISGVEICIVDDHSHNTKTEQLVRDFPASCKIYLSENKGVSNALLIGMEYLWVAGCNIAMNLDSDCVVKPDFVRKITDLKTLFPNQIVSGFNSTIRNQKSGRERYPAIETFFTYLLKSNLGGCNFCVNKLLYDRWWKPVLDATKNNRKHHDQRLSTFLHKNGTPFVVTYPGVIQHIGVQSSLGHNLGEYTCADENFVE